MRLMIAGLCLVAGVFGADVKPLTSKDLVGIAGKEAVMLTVEYAPGESSSPHRHNAQTFVYVLEGSIIMQVKGGNAVTPGPGETFFASMSRAAPAALRYGGNSLHNHS